MGIKSRWQNITLPMADGDEGGGAGGNGDDATKLKSALDKERKAREAAEKKLRDKEEAEALANKSLTDQVATLQQQLTDQKAVTEQQAQTYQAQLAARDVSFAFSSALADAKVLPEYRDRFGDLVSGLKYEGGKLLTTEGQPFDTATLRIKYPAMFAPETNAAGSGAQGVTAPAPVNGVRTVSAADLAALSAIDINDLISGKVVIQ